MIRNQGKFPRFFEIPFTSRNCRCIHVFWLCRDRRVRGRSCCSVPTALSTRLSLAGFVFCTAIRFERGTDRLAVV